MESIIRATAVSCCFLAFATVLSAGGFDVEIRAEGVDKAERDSLAQLAEDGAPLVSEALGVDWESPFELVLMANREAFTRALPAEWGLGETACWMVAVGVSNQLVMLVPSAWPEDACEHDPEDEAHIAKLLRHELVHVLHGQHHPIGDFTGSEDMGWFLEGLAVMASGQLDDTGHRRRAEEALAIGGPTSLAEVWSGPARYGLAGTLVESLVTEHGRSVLKRLLPVQHTTAALDTLEAHEQQILANWRRSMASK